MGIDIALPLEERLAIYLNEVLAIDGQHLLDGSHDR
jgi:hypothetical protein